MVFESLIGLMGAGAGGGILGLVGNAMTQRSEAKKQKEANAFEAQQKKEDNAHRLAVMEQERQALQLEIQGRDRVAQVEAETTTAADRAAIISSYAADTVSYGHGSSSIARFLLDLVDVVRGLTRPLLTASTLWLLFTVWQDVAGLQGPQVIALQTKLIAVIVFLATTAFTWWFASRAPKWAR